MRRQPVRILAAALSLLVGAALVWTGWWYFDGRWRPHTLTRDAAQLDRLVAEAGWVSPGLHGPALYMVSFRSCPDCVRLERTQFPDFQKAGIDTRVIVVARRSKSTPAERATVAALWTGRSWPLFEQWTSTPIPAWSAPGLPSAEGDPARTAQVERGRALVDRLTPILRENGVSPEMHYPTLLWRDARGRWRGCNCEDPRTYRHLRRDLSLPA